MDIVGQIAAYYNKPVFLWTPSTHFKDMKDFPMTVAIAPTIYTNSDRRMVLKADYFLDGQDVDGVPLRLAAKIRAVFLVNVEIIN
ncbi:unnamed protein product [Gongylonema pulchrum]|uniref:CN hydrolase domain-containing protein n=1 Tax=Gongylonema pulchrum TaxID=637853 RepID=A0A183CX40_9BILA|nr:unnamed protein product [Gongylonema pulchrum]